MNKKTAMINKIRKHWDKRARNGLDGKLVTHVDNVQVDMEISLIKKYIDSKDYVLDIGCGTGFSTKTYSKCCRKIIGMDYSDDMLLAARKNVEGNVIFLKGDVLKLDFKDNQFDKVISTRCLINLINWQDQKKAIKNIHRVLKKGGYFIMLEGIKEGREAINELRTKVGLSKMPDVWHNQDLPFKKLELFLKDYFILKKKISFGLYDLATRVIYALSVYPHEPQYNTPLHKAIAEVNKATDCCSDYAKICLYILKKI